MFWVLLCCSTNDGAVAGVPLEHSVPLASAYALAPPPYTNYVPNFIATLDWVFYDTTQLDVVAVLNVPPPAAIDAHTALPNVCAPSDHLSLSVRLRYKQ